MPPAAANNDAKRSGLAYWAARVLEECDKAASGFDADPVHDLRVAIRRCRSMADGFRSVDPDPAWKQMKRLAKPLFRSLGELRDTQVMAEWLTKLAPHGDPVGQDLSSALLTKEHHLKSAAKDALASFDRKRWAALNEHLATRTASVPLEGRVFQELALERWLEARELHRRALRNRSGVAWHQLRIGIKRFRYTVENFLPQRHEKWSKDLRELQDALGEVHDFDVLRAMINSHEGIGREERLLWQKRIAEERQQRLALYRSKMVGRGSLWERWRAELPQGAALQAAAMAKLRTWAAMLDPDRRHSERVAQLALALYDGLSQCGILSAVPKDRRILQAAALLHEVGRGRLAHRDSQGHQKRGQRMVAKLKAPLGWCLEDMRCVAALVRFHRGRLPLRSNPCFAGLDRKRRAGVMRLMGILRLANAFDETHAGKARDLSVTLQKGALIVRCYGLAAMSREAERAARARYLLEMVFRRPIGIHFPRARSAGGVQAARLQRRAAPLP